MSEKLSDAWQCQSCGCYFPHIPKILDNDVKRCSKCVEVEALEQRYADVIKANAEVAKLNADLQVEKIDLEQRVERLKPYLIHGRDCRYDKGDEDWDAIPCNCGLMEALASQEEV